MKRYIYGCFLLLALPTLAQQPDSLRTLTDSAAHVAERAAFDAQQGPAEHVFSLINIPVYQFNSGTYRITDRAFPLMASPDSLVSLPAKRAHRQSRTGLFAGIASVIPLVVMSYSVVRLAAAPLTLPYGQTYQRDDPKPVLVAAGITAGVGVVVSATFNLASVINVTKAIRRHNARFGRRVPTLFNPRGL